MQMRSHLRGLLECDRFFALKIVTNLTEAISTIAQTGVIHRRSPRIPSQKTALEAVGALSIAKPVGENEDISQIPVIWMWWRGLLDMLKSRWWSSIRIGSATQHYSIASGLCMIQPVGIAKGPIVGNSIDR